MPLISKPSHSSDTSNASFFPSTTDADLGSCRRAGRQDEAAPVPVPRNDGPTDIFGRPLDRRQQALNTGFTRGRGWIEWPKIGAGLDLPQGETFDWAAHSDAFAGGATTSVYVAIADGLCDLGKASRLCLAKIGTSTRPDMKYRMAEANADRYGSLHHAEGHILEAEGFTSWEAVRIQDPTGSDYESPVESLSRSLMVSLPSGFDAKAFDDALTAALDHCRADKWIETPDGQHYCARHEVDARTLHRLTAHINADGSIRLKKAREIYIFRREDDIHLLVRLIEGLIARHLTDKRR